MYINYLAKPDTGFNPTPTFGVIKTKIIDNKPLQHYNISIEDIEFITRYYTGTLEYTTFEIPKHSGGTRTIEAPNENLKRLQRTYLNILQKSKINAHNAAHGFVKYRNCKTALEVHQQNKSRWFLKLDISNFFPSITHEMLISTLPNIYPFNHICDWSWLTLCELEGRLPQGAPTSPFLANMVMIPYDIAVTKYCTKHGLVYTRYADDILISSTVKWDWNETLNDIKDILSVFTINPNKVRFGSFNGRNWNLGIMYNNSYGLTVGHEFKHLAKVVVHNAEVNGISVEEKEKWLGKLGYAKFIEPDNETLDNLFIRLKCC